MLRLRQIAFAARDLAAAEAAVTDALAVERCHRDPGVAVFGLANALFPVGDQFLEVVSPTGPGTTAGRLLDKRGGDCGYMALFQVDDLAPVETRLAELGVRVVFDAAAEAVRGLHLHPKDVPGAIVSIDAARDPEDWPWAGPTWGDHVRTDRVTAVVGLTVATDDPAATAGIWADVLGIERPVGPRSSAVDADRPGGGIEAAATLEVDDAVVRFTGPTADGRRGIVGVDVAAVEPARRGAVMALLGVDVRFV